MARRLLAFACGNVPYVLLCGLPGAALAATSLYKARTTAHRTMKRAGLAILTASSIRERSREITVPYA